jgi:hypothetical protein
MKIIALFDPIGRFFFEKKRSYLFIGLLSSPFVLIAVILFPRFMALRNVERTFDEATLHGREALEKRHKKDLFLSHYSNSEPYFIDQHLESLSFLQGQLKELQIMKNHPACPDREAVKRRIEWLEGAENHLAFAEENIRSSKKVKETEERQIRPIEVDVDDLEHLLSLIEDLPIGSYQPNPHSPQLVIQDLLLTKKLPTTFDLTLSLIKREFTTPYEKKN